MTLPDTAMLLCAGMGTRLQPCGLDVPKCMALVGGKPLLQHTVQLLSAYGVRRVVINLRHRPHCITEHFGDGRRFGVQITYSREAEPLGTAGAVRQIAHLFTTPFFVWYGDNLSGCRLDHLYALHARTGSVLTLAVLERDDVSQSGIVATASDGRIERFLEKPSPAETFSRLVNAGIMVVDPSVLDVIPSARPVDFAREVFPRLLQEGRRMFAYRLSADEGLWWIDTPEDLVRTQTTWRPITAS